MLALFLLFFSACRKKDESISPTVGSITESVYASGVVRSRGQASVYASASGILQKSLVSVGDTVKKGEPLFILVHDGARLQTENARLAADFADIDARRDKLAELQVQIGLAREKMLADSSLFMR